MRSLVFSSLLFFSACGPATPKPDAGARPPPYMALSPQRVELVPGETTGFSVIVTETDNGENAMAELLVTGGEVGAVAANLLQYRAPMAVGKYTLRVTYKADPTYYVESEIEVKSPTWNVSSLPPTHEVKPEGLVAIPGTSTFIVSELGHAYRWDLSDNSFQRVVTGASPSSVLAVSRDKRWVFMALFGRVTMVNAETMQPFTHFDFEGTVHGLVSAPGNALLVSWRPTFTGNFGSVTRITLADGKDTATISSGAVSQPNIVMSPDDSQLVVFDPLQASVLQASTGLVLDGLNSAGGSSQLAFSVDGATVGYATGRGALWVKFDTRMTLHESPDRRGFAMDPLGTYSVAGRVDSGAKNLRVCSQDGVIKDDLRSRPALADQQQRSTRSLHFSGDGQHLVVLEGEGADFETVVVPRASLPP